MTLQIPCLIHHLLVFIDTHLVYWLICLALGGEVRYLLNRSRKEVIAMSGWGEASRREQPLFFYFLWVLHVIGTLFFTLLFVGYLIRMLG